MDRLVTELPQRFVISHLNESDFKIGGLRNYSAYRDLGVAAATNGLAHAHVIRMIAPFSTVQRATSPQCAIPTCLLPQRMVSDGL